MQDDKNYERNIPIYTVDKSEPLSNTENFGKKLENFFINAVFDVVEILETILIIWINFVENHKYTILVFGVAIIPIILAVYLTIKTF